LNPFKGSYLDYERQWAIKDKDQKTIDRINAQLVNPDQARQIEYDNHVARQYLSDIDDAIRKLQSEYENVDDNIRDAYRKQAQLKEDRHQYQRWLSKYGKSEQSEGFLSSAFHLGSFTAAYNYGAGGGVFDWAVSGIAMTAYAADNVFTVATLPIKGVIKKGLTLGAEAAAHLFGTSTGNTVYRVLRAGEDTALGLVAKNPDAAYSLTSFVSSGSRLETQYIATTRSLDVARKAMQKYGGSQIVAIDLTKARGLVYDLTNPAARNAFTNGFRAKNYAAASQEIDIWGWIPAEAITPVK
jgi:hypothetical protein